MSKENNQSAEYFRKEILKRIQNAKGKDKYVAIRAGDIAGQGHRPQFCGAMRSVFVAGDKIAELPKGRHFNQKGSTFDEQAAGQKWQGANLVVLYNSNTNIQTRKNENHS